DLTTVDTGSLHACKWRSHTNPPLLLFESESPARCLGLVVATLDRPRFRGNSAHQCSGCNVRFWHKADITTRATNVRFWGQSRAMSAFDPKRTSVGIQLTGAGDSFREHLLEVTHGPRIS